MEVTLQILHGRLKSGTGVPKVEGFTIRQPQFVIGGDAACDMLCRSRLVSPRHCQITLSERAVTLEDLNSEHGTFVNGIRVEGTTILKTGDVLKVGRLEFFVSVGAAHEVLPRAAQPPAAQPPAAQPPASQPPATAAPPARDTVSMSAASSETIVDAPPVQTPADGRESVDDLVTHLLEEADELEREMRRADPASRYMKVEMPAPAAKSEEQPEPEAEPAEERRKRPARKRPIKLPADKLGQTPHITGRDSVNAAELALEELLRAPKK